MYCPPSPFAPWESVQFQLQCFNVAGRVQWAKRKTKQNILWQICPSCESNSSDFSSSSQKIRMAISETKRAKMPFFDISEIKGLSDIQCIAMVPRCPDFRRHFRSAFREGHPTRTPPPWFLENHIADYSWNLWLTYGKNLEMTPPPSTLFRKLILAGWHFPFAWAAEGWKAKHSILLLEYCTSNSRCSL